MNDLVEETKNELHQKINKSKDAENAEEKRIVEEITRRETEVKTAEVQRSKLLDEQKKETEKVQNIDKKLSHLCSLLANEISKSGDSGDDGDAEIAANLNEVIDTVVNSDVDGEWIAGEKHLVEKLVHRGHTAFARRETELIKKTEFQSKKLEELDVLKQKSGDAEKHEKQLKELQKRLSDSENELASSEANGHQLTAKNAELTRTIAELENLLKKSKEMIDGVASGKIAQGSDSMKNLTNSLGSSMAAVMDKNSEEAAAASNNRRMTAMASLKNVKNFSTSLTKLVSGGSKKSRMTMLQGIGSADEEKKHDEENNDEEEKKDDSREREVKEERVKLASFVEKEEEENDDEDEEEDAEVAEIVSKEVENERSKIDDVIARSALPKNISPAKIVSPTNNDFVNDNDNDPEIEAENETETKAVTEAEAGTDPNSSNSLTPSPTDTKPQPKPAKKIGGFGIGLAMKMNKRRATPTTDDGSSGSSDPPPSSSVSPTSPPDDDAAHTFNDRLMYHGVKKQSANLFSAVKSSAAANFITQMSKRAGAAVIERDRKASELAEQTKQKELHEESLRQHHAVQAEHAEKLEAAKQTGDGEALATLQKTMEEIEAKKAHMENKLHALTAVVHTQEADLKTVEAELDSLEVMENNERHDVTAAEVAIGTYRKLSASNSPGAATATKLSPSPACLPPSPSLSPAGQTFTPAKVDNFHFDEIIRNLRAQNVECESVISDLHLKVELLEANVGTLNKSLESSLSELSDLSHTIDDVSTQQGERLSRALCGLSSFTHSNRQSQLQSVNNPIMPLPTPQRKLPMPLRWPIRQKNRRVTRLTSFLF